MNNCTLQNRTKQKTKTDEKLIKKKKEKKGERTVRYSVEQIFLNFGLFFKFYGCKRS